VSPETARRNPKTRVDVTPGAGHTLETTAMAPHNNIRAKISIHPIMKMNLLFELTYKAGLWPSPATSLLARTMSPQ